MNFLKKLIQFLKDVAADSRIPERDKTVLMALIVLLVSPIDIIPDWIPFFGQLDDIVILAIILDYFFRVLDSQILLSHYPWGMKSYAWLRRITSFLSFFVPSFVTKRIWKYVPPAY